jgi:hypothetical protein
VAQTCSAGRLILSPAAFHSPARLEIKKGFDILDLASPECITMMADFKRAHPNLWNECVGEG